MAQTANIPAAARSIDDRGSRLAANLRVDVAGAQVREWLAQEDIDCVLIKGRAFAQRLYDQLWERTYSDTDLLIRPTDRERAERLLVSHGYRRIDRDSDRLGQPAYAHTFTHLDGSLIDLHWNLSGATAGGQRTWDAVRARTVSLSVGGRPAQVPDDEATALIVALHNAHHGAKWSTAQRDLERALEHLAPAAWDSADRLAHHLGARDAFVAGLRLSPAGMPLADRLGACEGVSLEYQLRARQTTYGAWALHRVASAGGLGRRAQVLGQVIVPPPATMRQFFPLARRGTLGLLAAYLLRPFKLARTALPTAAEYRRARRLATRQSPRHADSNPPAANELGRARVD